MAYKLQHIMQSHAQYPILHYFRPVDDRQSLAIRLRPLLRLHQKHESSGGDGEQRLSRAAALSAKAIEHYLTAADNRFVPGAGIGASRRSLDQRYDRLLTYLGYTRP